ncbi:LCP family protein [Herbidospora mongoliensis]|uniref:LCP family protein n=1 Tax=Herbidospora mongoliensis TaxID=688067 RepID=UPI000A5A18E5|nr:LCP family protein [Herbidospora mongoliensis]
MSDHRNVPSGDQPGWGSGAWSFGAANPANPGGPPQQQPPFEPPPMYPEPAPRRRETEGDPDFDENRWGVGDRWDDDEEPRRFRWLKRRKNDEEEAEDVPLPVSPPQAPVPVAAAPMPHPAPLSAPIGGPPGPPGRPPKAPKGGGGRGPGKKAGLGALGWVSVVLTTVMVAGSLTAYTVYRRTLGNIRTTSLDGALGENRPENQTGALNVLLVGSDTRQGDNARYGQKAAREDKSERTDTIMLLHVSPQRDKALLISFPRDSMVQIPSCDNVQTEQAMPAQLGMINSAFNLGGIVCTIKTIEALTDIRVDHYIKVDFTGFKNIVNALGGIEVCLPQAVDDRASKLKLPAGRQIVQGEEALGYVRIRKIGNNSDLERIKRQQVFLSQVVKKATSSALVTDFAKLAEFIGAATSSVETDDQLNTETLIQVAQSAQKLTAKGFKAVTVPVEAYVADANRVQWRQPQANNLFAAIRTDSEVSTAAPSPPASAAPPAEGGSSEGGGEPKPSAPAGPKPTEPAQVRVQVVNGTNTDGKASEVAEALTAQGFRVTQIGDGRKADGSDQETSSVAYKGAGWEGSKMLVASLLKPIDPSTTLLPVANVKPFTATTPAPGGPKKAVGPIIQIVVGKDWGGVKVPLSAAEDESTVDSNTDICAT